MQPRIQLVKFNWQWPFIQFAVPLERHFLHPEHYYDSDHAGPPIEKRIDFQGRIPLTRPSSLLSSDATLQPCPLKSLPRELRDKIWRLVLQEPTHHLFLRNCLDMEAAFFPDNDPTPRRLVGQACAFPRDRLCDLYAEARSRGNESKGLKQPGALSLLLTCKQFYSEVVDLLYATTNFVVTDSDVLENLSTVLLPQRLQSIRSLRFNWHRSPYYNDPFIGPLEPKPQGPKGYRDDAIASRQARWNAIWLNISKLQALNRLEFILPLTEDYWRPMSAERAENLLAPLRQVTKSNVFLLIIPWPVDPQRILSTVPETGDYLAPSYPELAGLHLPRDVNPWSNLPCTVLGVSSLEDISQAGI